MLRALVDRILEIHKPGEIVTHEIGGQAYTRNKDLIRLRRPEEHKPNPLTFYSLNALIDFALYEGIREEKDAILAVQSHEVVKLYSRLQPSNDNDRFCYAVAELNFKPFVFGQWMDLETFVINLQACFIQDESVAAILSMLSCLYNEQVQENKDDGFTQSLSIRTGITTKEKAQLVNPVTLRPFRTFSEVDQPEGAFIIRFRNTGKGIECVLFEAGGGHWKIRAIMSIAEYLARMGDANSIDIPVIA